MISLIQELHFELLKQAKFNNLDGPQIVKDLLNYPHLWKSVMAGRFYHQDLIHLRDMADNFWNIDSLAILSTRRNNRRLEELVDSWGPDSIDWLNVEEASELLGTISEEQELLLAWWD